MKTIDFKNQILPHIIAVISFYLLVQLFFSPLNNGKALSQSDISHGVDITNQIKKWEQKTGEAAMWNPYTFSGMPAYIFGVTLPGQAIKGNVNRTFSLFIKAPANILFTCLLCTYLLLLTYKVNPYLAIMGAVAFAFGTFNIISIEFGHNAKIRALAFVPLVLAGTNLIWEKKYLLGSAIGLLGFLFLFYTGHYQIAYYTAIVLFIQFVTKTVLSFKQLDKAHLIKVYSITAAIGFAGILSNIGNIWIVMDYQSESIRGKQILQSKKQDENKSTAGLDRDYVFSWSQGLQESFTLLIHNSYGGGSAQHYEVKEMESYKLLKRAGVDRRQAEGLIKQSLYWGDQPFTAGAIYMGAVICFLFVLGMFLLPNEHRIWLGIATSLFLMLSWGKNFESLNYFLFDHLPMYNKFRTVTMTLGIVNLTLVIGAVLGIQEFLKQKEKVKDITKSLYISFAIVGGLAFVFWLLPNSFFDFSKSLVDEEAQFAQMFGNNQSMGDQFFNALTNDRMVLLKSDALLSLTYIIIAFGALILFVRNILQETFTIGVIATASFIDIVATDRRYITTTNFVREKKSKDVVASKSDKEILSQNINDKRVFLPGGGMSNSKPSYFHKSSGGYHPAKMRRYQDLADYHFGSQGKQPTVAVLQMLNIGFIQAGPEQTIPFNQGLGHAWFIESLRSLSSEDSIMNALYTFNPSTEAFSLNTTSDSFQKGALSRISQTSFTPNKITYQSQNSNDGYGVFSEVYYNKGWNAYVDGKEQKYDRVNYLLRGLKIPAGTHEIVFEFRPTSYIIGSQLNLIFTILGLLYGFGVIGWLAYKESNR